MAGDSLNWRNREATALQAALRMERQTRLRMGMGMRMVCWPDGAWVHLIVCDDAVVDDHKLAVGGGGHVRVRIDHTRRTVRGPAGVRDAAVAVVQLAHVHLGL